MSPADVRSRVGGFLQRTPAWWTMGLTGAAWLYLLAAGMDPAGHDGPHPSGAAMHWLAMICAMMAPLVWGHVSLVAERSLWRRRHRAIALFLASYIATWAAYGALVTTALGSAAIPLQPALCLLAAALWQLTPWKLRALRRCHRSIPLAPSGGRADRDCLRYGWMTGGNCLLSCWALMLVCAAGRLSVWLMVGLTAFTVAERVADRPRRTRFAAALSAGALASAGLSMY